MAGTMLSAKDAKAYAATIVKDTFFAAIAENTGNRSGLRDMADGVWNVSSETTEFAKSTSTGTQAKLIVVRFKGSNPAGKSDTCWIPFGAMLAAKDAAWGDAECVKLIEAILQGKAFTVEVAKGKLVSVAY